MRALVVAASPLVPSAGLLGRLASECDFIVAVDGGAHALEAAHIVPDVLIGDSDSARQDVVNRLSAAGVECVLHPALKDVSDLDLALDLCLDRGCDSVVATGVLGGRLDHLLVALGTLADHSACLRIDLVSDASAGWLLDHASRSWIRLTGPRTTVSLLALAGSAVVSVTGMYWPLTERRLAPLSSLGLSNRLEDDFAEIVVHDGHVLVYSEDLGEGIAALVCD